MKKIFALCAAALLAVGMVFAQSEEITIDENPYADTATRVMTVDDKYPELHPHAGTVKLSLEYTPVSGEVLVYYECLAASYDQGEAMNSIDAVLEDFARDNQFTRLPKIVKKDKATYFKTDNGLRMARYRRWVRFER